MGLWRIISKLPWQLHSFILHNHNILIKAKSKLTKKVKFNLHGYSTDKLKNKSKRKLVKINQCVSSPSLFTYPTKKSRNSIFSTNSYSRKNLVNRLPATRKNCIKEKLHGREFYEKLFRRELYVWPHAIDEYKIFMKYYFFKRSKLLKNLVSD